MEKMKNNGENSGPLTSLPVNRLMATDCNAAARANNHTKCVVNFPLVLPNWVGILSWLP